MTHQVREFVTRFIDKYGEPKKVLEIGSREVDGRIRDLFPNTDYTGLDLERGVGVEVTMNAHDLKEKFKRDSFDLVICCETLEHDDKFWLTVENMRWILKPGGFMIISVPGQACPEHAWPLDCWRFMRDGVTSFFEDFEDVLVEAWYTTDHEKTAADGWCASGRKKKND